MSDSLAIKLAQARYFAAKAHHEQRYGSKPYVAHLDEVLSVAFQFYVTDEDILVATMLHDVVEDTEIKLECIQKQFGVRVAELVNAVTNEQGKTRKERNILTYPKIRTVNGATTLKLCDRIANVRNCWMESENFDANKRSKSMLGMYKKEYGAFRKALKVDNDSNNTQLWLELDRLMAWSD